MSVKEFFKKLFATKKEEGCVREESSEYQPSKPDTDPDIQTIYFCNGKLYKVIGKDPDNWYDADILISDGITYDLHSADHIRSIPIPNFDQHDNLMSGYGITGSLEYVLRMKAGALYNRYERELCSACLWKSTEMMFAFEHRWQKKDFDRIIHWHYELSMPEEAEKAKAWLSTSPLYTENPFDRNAKSMRDSIFSKHDGDLVVFNDHLSASCYCSECAKLRGRVYSISGKSKVYPALPEYAKVHGNFHPGCRCMMSPFFEDAYDYIYFRGKEVDPIEASNRPWEDDRTDEEKAEYECYVSRKEAESIHDDQKLDDKRVYYDLLSKLPNDAPKSFSAYRRMKNSNSVGYQKLKAKASEIGIEI